MQTRLANRLLRELTAWSEADEQTYMVQLQTMAEWKWDHYEGFRAGQRFMESLVRWLPHLPDTKARMRWIDFLLNQLIFISHQEMDHAIATVYPDVIRRDVIARVAKDLSLSPFLLRRIVTSTEFAAEQRRLLVLGLSDGAQLDHLRRSATGLSHEQFYPSAEVPQDKAQDLLEKLDHALKQFGSVADRNFNHVLLVDDFYGSGTSLIKREESEAGTGAGGKLGKFLVGARRLVEDGILNPDFSVTVVLYVASARAATYIRETMATCHDTETWRLSVVQEISERDSIVDEQLLVDSDAFWDPVLQDQHKKAAPRGFLDCALPLVLYHNSPNNSLSPL